MQRARRSQDGSDWEAVSRFLAEDVVVEAAADGSHQLWRELSGRTAVMNMGREPRNTWSRLQTETLNLFGDDEQALVEQLSTVTSETGAKEVLAWAFVFRVADERIIRIRRYGTGRGVSN